VNGALTDMAMLNLVAVIFLVILVVSAIVGIVLVNKGQHRKHFLKELKISVVLCISALVALCVLIATTQALG
jgi:fumarate reductase subunit C